MDRVILPALGRGEWVLCDRFIDSTMAYQGYARGMDIATLDAINAFAIYDREPDLTLLLDLGVEAGFARLKERYSESGDSHDRFEREARAFHERVREGYHKLAERAPERFRVVDADQPCGSGRGSGLVRGRGGIAPMMDTLDLHAEAWEGIKNGYASGRLAACVCHRGISTGKRPAFRRSRSLSCSIVKARRSPAMSDAGCRQVEAHKHVDTLWIEPQSKSRQITTDDARGLIQRMTQTSFEGGWKAGVILCADCLNVNSENALLKTLEEPPPKSLLLLVTDSAESLLPTIISRCQKICAFRGQGGCDG